VPRLIGKWIFGCTAFASPSIVAGIGQALDRSAFQHHPSYKTLIPVFVWGSLALAAVVPAILLLGMSGSIWRRVSYLIAVWCLLIFELYWTFLVVIARP